MTGTIPSRASGRTQLVTDRTTSNASLNTSVTREVYTTFERIADARGISKAALMRELVEKHIHENGAGVAQSVRSTDR